MTDLSVQLANVINENMTKFLGKVSTEFEIDETKLLEMWSSFSGEKTKDKKNIKKIKKEKIVKKIEKKDKGPTIKELKEELKSLGLKVSGNKAELIKRLEEHSSKSKTEKIYRYETGKYQKEYDTLWKKYVPQSGCCSDDHAEQFRLCSRIYYRVYNDGDFQGGYPSELNKLIQERYLYDEDYPLDVISGIEDILSELEDEEYCDNDCESDCEPQHMSMSEKYNLVEEMMDASIKYAYDKLENN